MEMEHYRFSVWAGEARNACDVAMIVSGALKYLLFYHLQLAEQTADKG